MLELDGMKSPARIAAVAVVLGAACGDGGSAESEATLSSAETSDSSPTGMSMSTSVSTSGDGDGDSATGDGDGDGEPTTSGDGDGDPATGDGDGEPTTSGTKFDMAAVPDLGESCQPGMGEDNFSYIWIADSTIGAISKIDTQTMEEVGRYIVRPDGNGSPSRTSVNLRGDVAVANRNGGITKVHARIEDCVDTNGMPGVQTSAGANDVLAWGVEECIAWHTPMNFSTQRPIAWGSGTLDQGTCTYVDAKVWTAGAQVNQDGSAVVSVLNGDDGSLEGEVAVPELTVGGFGPYGGAVDANGDFWFIDSGNEKTEAPLIRVHAEDLSYELWPTPAGMRPYGLAIDVEGRPWVTGYNWGVARFDPDSETFDASNQDTAALGIMPGPDGRMWAAIHPSNGQGVFGLDVDTLEQTDWIELPSSLAWGVSVDFQGYVWMVDRGASDAYRIDPETYEYDVYTDLVGAYTYSDMTGWGLSLVTSPEG